MKKTIALCLALNISFAGYSMDTESKEDATPDNSTVANDVLLSIFGGEENNYEAIDEANEVTNDKDIFAQNPWEACITSPFSESVRLVTECAPRFVLRNDFSTMMVIFQKYIVPLVVQLSRTFADSSANIQEIKDIFSHELENIGNLAPDQEVFIEDFAKGYHEQINAITQTYIKYKKIRIFADKTNLDSISEKVLISSWMNHAQASENFFKNFLVECFEYDFKDTIGNEDNSKRVEVDGDFNPWRLLDSVQDLEHKPNGDIRTIDAKFFINFYPLTPAQKSEYISALSAPFDLTSFDRFLNEIDFTPLKENAEKLKSIIRKKAEICDNYRKLIICAAAFSSGIHKIRVIPSEIGSVSGNGDISLNFSEGEAKNDEIDCLKYSSYLGKEVDNDTMLGYVFFHELGHVISAVFNSLYENVPALENILYYDSENTQNANLYHVFLAKYISEQIQLIDNYKYEHPGSTDSSPEVVKLKERIKPLVKEVKGDIDGWIKAFYEDRIKELMRIREWTPEEDIVRALMGYNWYDNLFSNVTWEDAAKLSKYIIANDFEKFAEELKEKEFKDLDFVNQYCQKIISNFYGDSHHSYSKMRNDHNPIKFQLGDFVEIFQMWGIGIFSNALYINPFCDLLNAQKLGVPIRHSHGIYLDGSAGPFKHISDEFLNNHKELENIETHMWVKDRERKFTLKDIAALHTVVYTSAEALRLILATQGLKNDALFPQPPKVNESEI